MSSWTPTTYKTTNWSDYNAVLKQRGSLSIWFDAEMDWEAQPSGKRYPSDEPDLTACVGVIEVSTIDGGHYEAFYGWQTQETILVGR